MFTFVFNQGWSGAHCGFVQPVFDCPIGCGSKIKCPNIRHDQITFLHVWNEKLIR